MRAILFASATRTSIGGLRDSIPPSHVPGLGRSMGMPFDDDAVGPNDKQAPQGPFAHLGRCSEPLFAVRRMLTGRETELSRKIPALAEGLGRRRKGRDGRGAQRADTGHHHQTPRHVVLFGATGDLGIERPDLFL